VYGTQPASHPKKEKEEEVTKEVGCCAVTIQTAVKQTTKSNVF
jgi:hypothetical protein